jgi:hypothetical protein
VRALAFGVTVAAVLVGHVTLGVLRQSLTRVSGDEGTFLAMTESLVRDGDLRFEEADLARVEAATEPGRKALILQRSEVGLAYSKPIVYPVVAAPAYALAGEDGLAALNVVLLAAALLLAGRALARWWGGAEAAAWTLVAAVGTSAVPSYVVYRMSDLLQVALALGGLALCLTEARGRALESGTPGLRGRSPDPVAPPAGGRRDREGRSSLWQSSFGGLLLGLAAVARYPNLLILAVAVGGLVVTRRWRAAAAALAAGGLAFVALSAWTAQLTGTANPYKAERASFDATSGHPRESDSAVAEAGFGGRLATQSLEARPVWSPAVSAWAGLYYLGGRHTGLLLYFPAAVLLLAAALRRPDRLSWVLVVGAAVGVLFYLVWMPRNYFGGSTFVGNRYFLTLFPLLLLAPSRSPDRRWLAAVWAAGLTVWLSATLSVARAGELDRSSQSHALAGIFPFLPYESTARALDGWRDRYWEDTFWRFTDPWVEVGEDGFLLEPGRPPAETLLAVKEPLEALRVAVRSEAAEVVLEVSDWRRSALLRLDLSATAGRAIVEVPVSKAWRRHPFWWAPETSYDIRALRWRIAGDAPARVRFLGVTAPAPAGG